MKVTYGGVITSDGDEVTFHGPMTITLTEPVTFKVTEKTHMRNFEIARPDGLLIWHRGDTGGLEQVKK